MATNLSKAGLQIAENLAAVRRRIDDAAARAGRTASEVTLIAVSKSQPDERIEAALEAGLRVFGENRIQEASRRWPELRERHPDIELHFIGHLQSNKAAEAVGLFDLIHALDRSSLAKALAREMRRQERRPTCLIQVNTGDEPQKGGIAPDAARDFLAYCRDELGLPVEGLMCIPPVEDEAAPHFALLRRMADELGLPKISMGMSADYEAAVELGATHVRVGTAIFGARIKAAAPGEKPASPG